MSDSSVQAKKPQLRIGINWRVCVFALFFFPLLVYLGFWQLQRADEKRTIQQLVEQQQVLPPQSIEKLLVDIEEGQTVLYRRVQAKGFFDQEHYWLIENRTHRGRNGFHVVVPLYLPSGQTVLINRGWVAGTGYREQLPEVLTPRTAVVVKGRLIKPSVNQLLLDETKSKGAWPRVILQIDMDIMSTELGKALVPLIMQIDAENVNALQVNWVVLNTPVSKHLGYAYQWFAMALALLVLTVFANTNLGLLLKGKG